MQHRPCNDEQLVMGMKKRIRPYFFGGDIAPSRKKRKLFPEETSRKHNGKAKSKLNFRSAINLTKEEEESAKIGHTCDLCGRFFSAKSFPKQFWVEFERHEGEDWFCHWCRYKANSQVLKGKDYSSTPGSLFQVYWGGDMRWYTCRVVKKDLDSGATTFRHLTAGMEGAMDTLKLSCEAVRWVELSVPRSRAFGKFAIPKVPKKRRDESIHNPYASWKKQYKYNALGLRYLCQLARQMRNCEEYIEPPYYCRTFTMWNANPYYRKGPRQKVKSRVNTISITNMNSRKGELITGSFNVEKSEWRVLVYVFGKYHCEGMSVYLQHNRFLDPQIAYQETEFKCTIVNVQDPLLHHSREFRHQYTAERSVCGFDIFLPLKDLYNGQYLCGKKKDTILLKTEIWCYGKEMVLPPSPPMSNGLPYNAPWQTQSHMSFPLINPALKPPRDLEGVHRVETLEVPGLELCTLTGETIKVKEVRPFENSSSGHPFRTAHDCLSVNEEHSTQKAPSISAQSPSLSDPKGKMNDDSISAKLQSNKSNSGRARHLPEISSSKKLYQPEGNCMKISMSTTRAESSVLETFYNEESRPSIVHSAEEVTNFPTRAEKEVVGLPTESCLQAGLQAQKAKQVIAQEAKEADCKEKQLFSNLNRTRTPPTNSTNALVTKKNYRVWKKLNTCPALKLLTDSTRAASQADRMYHLQATNGTGYKVVAPSYFQKRLGVTGNGFLKESGMRNCLARPVVTDLSRLNPRIDEFAWQLYPTAFRLKTSMVGAANQLVRQKIMKRAADENSRSSFLKVKRGYPYLHSGKTYANSDALRLQKLMAEKYPA